DVCSSDLAVRFGNRLCAARLPPASGHQHRRRRRLAQRCFGQCRAERGGWLGQPAEQFAGHCRGLQCLLRQRQRPVTASGKGSLWEPSSLNTSGRKPMRVFSIASIALVLLCGEVLAARMPFAVLPGGATAFLEVQSIRERRFNNLIQQETDFSCGAASLATVLREAYDFDVNEQMVIEGMLAGADQAIVRTQGFSMLDMKRYV